MEQGSSGQARWERFSDFCRRTWKRLATPEVAASIIETFLKAVVIAFIAAISKRYRAQPASAAA